MSNIRIRVGAFIEKNGQILLVRHEKEGNSYWLLPGGGVEKNETLVEAIIRELYEELSLNIKPEELLFICESISSDSRHILHLTFKVEIISGSLKVNPDHRLRDAKYFNTRELNEIEIRPNIKNLLLKLLNKEEIEEIYRGNLWK